MSARVELTMLALISQSSNTEAVIGLITRSRQRPLTVMNLPRYYLDRVPVSSPGNPA